MATVNYHFRESTIKGYHKGKIFIRIIHKRKSKNIPTAYSLYPEEWSKTKKTVILPAHDFVRKRALLEMKYLMQRDFTNIESCISKLSIHGEFTAEDIAREFKTIHQTETLLGYSRNLESLLLANGQTRTARGYRSTVNSFLESVQDINFKLSDLDRKAIERYAHFLSCKGLALGTVSFYMRTLRAIFNRAVDDGLIFVLPHEKPFRNVFTGYAPTKKRALTREEFKKVLGTMPVIEKKIERIATKTEHGKELNQYRDLKNSLLYFLFSYHARGLSFIDLAHLKKSCIKSDVLTYQRKKTGKTVQVKVTGDMKKILAYFSQKVPDSEYLFPIVLSGSRRSSITYESALRKQNVLLHQIGEISELTEQRLTTYVARHCFATHLKWEGISIGKISEMLGHHNEKTTRIYLDSFEKNETDLISEKISSLARVRFREVS